LIPGAVDRSQFDSQLKDPRVMAAFAGRMHSEVGSQGPAAQLAFAEEVMNRAASRNQTIMQALTGKYYPTHSPGWSNNPRYMDAINKAWKEGTDTIFGATGNASGKVGFGVRGGHYDANRQWVSPNQTVRINGERFGYEQVDLIAAGSRNINSSNLVAEFDLNFVRLTIPQRNDGALVRETSPGDNPKIVHWQGLLRMASHKNT
jgi:hypothetical protein